MRHQWFLFFQRRAGLPAGRNGETIREEVLPVAWAQALLIRVKLAISAIISVTFL
jgi:hypothetical protein